ncbi:MAG: helix-turn-helix domain-containing protein, partial [Pseudomonadota bacterium]
RARHPAARILVADVQKPVGSALLAVDRDDIVIGATRAARIAFDLGVDAPIEAVPAADILGDAKDGLRDAQRTVVVQALTRAEGNASSAAKHLGISRATLYRRMNRLGINRGTDDLSQD